MTSLGALILILWPTMAPPVETPPPPTPFDAAIWAPADVTWYVHVEGAAKIRTELVDRPIARWINTAFLQHGQFRKAWSGLAQAARMDGGQLFDACMGRRCTLLVRGGNEWAVVSDVDEAQALKLLRQLKVRVREPRNGMAIAELPEQEMLLARNGAVLAIGPTRQPGLLYEVLSRLETKNAANLAAEPCMTRARALGPGCMGVMVRHKPPMGGYSAAVADLHGDQLVIHHAAHFDHAPFNHGITTLTCDFSPIKLFENHSLLAVMQPADVGDGPIEAFVSAQLHEGLISKSMRENLGDRRLVVVGETEGRRLEQPVDVLSTTFVCCLQVKDREPAQRLLDQQMVRITRRINELGKGAFLVQTPHRRCLRSGEPREVDLSDASSWFTGGFPIMKNMTLSWTVADGPQGAWFVIGSHRRSLDDVVKALKDDGTADERLVGKFDSCGIGSGRRIERHLQSWSDQAQQFAEPDKVDEFRATLRRMSELAGGMQKCRWQLARPTANEMRLDVQIELAPPESARQD